MMVRFNPFMQLVQLLLIPFYVNFLNIKLFGFMNNQNNGLNTAEIRGKLTSQKQIAFVHDININVLKKRGKELKCSLNDIVITCVSRMFKQYLVEKAGDTKTNTVRLAFPLSLNPPPQSIDEIVLGNKFAIVPMDVKLVDDLQNGLKVLQ